MTAAAAEPLRVLLVSANFRPSVGGIERYVDVLAHGLADRGHIVTVAACRTDGGAREEEDRGVHVVRIPATDVFDRRFNVPYPLPEPIAALRVLRRLVAQADVVNPQDAIYATSVISLALARRRKAPSVLTQHVAFVPQRGRTLDAAQRAAIATLGRSARLATSVVSYNPAVANWAERTWSLRDVRVLPPGVPDPPRVDCWALRRELGLPAGRFFVLFVGRDVPKKGLDVLLAARDPAFEILAVTDRPASQVPGDVRILPFMDPERLHALMCCVDAFVLPSEGEGFPLALQEALVAGLPSVVVAGPGYDRYVQEGELLLAPRNPMALRTAILRLVHDDELRRGLGERARTAGLREFGVGQFVDGYERLYREVTSS